jgi:ABC-2 type transport system permease protein
MRAHQRGTRRSAAGTTFGGIGLAVALAILADPSGSPGSLQTCGTGDYLLRVGLSWLFLTFLSFLRQRARDGPVTFFLSDDLRLLAAPVPRGGSFTRDSREPSGSPRGWSSYLAPLLLSVGIARCAPWSFYASAVLTIVPFTIIPSRSAPAHVRSRQRVSHARRELPDADGLLFAASIVILLRYIRPERLMRVESLPDVTGSSRRCSRRLPLFFRRSGLVKRCLRACRRRESLHFAALWTTAVSMMLLLRLAHERWHFGGYSNAQEARKARFTKLRSFDRLAGALPISTVRRHLLLKDAKVFFRDVSQWSQLLLLVALMLVYLYNFRVLDLDRLPYVSGVVKNVYAFVNLGMAGLVMATVTVRFVFPGVSSEGAAFWIIRTAPISLRDFLWSKFWIGLMPVLVLTEALTIAANYLLGVDPFLAGVAPVTVLFMSFALVGLATGLGARYARFSADNASQVAGSYGGIAFR